MLIVAVYSSWTDEVDIYQTDCVTETEAILTVYRGREESQWKELIACSTIKEMKWLIGEWEETVQIQALKPPKKQLNVRNEI